eukprot:12541222-Alexandrium_andersonii.AAC.1
MSASLVGSEMCIRDRRGRPPRQTDQLPARIQEEGPCGRRPRPGPPPVSYTHLTLPTICSV